MSTSIQQQSISTLFHQLDDSSKISKKPLNDINQLLSSIGNITTANVEAKFTKITKNSPKLAELMSNPIGFKTYFENKLEKKLSLQNSGMLNKKSDGLATLKAKLLNLSYTHTLKNLEQQSAKLTKDINSANFVIEITDSNVIKLDSKIENAKKEINTEGSSLSQEDREELLKDTEMNEIFKDAAQRSGNNAKESLSQLLPQELKVNNQSTELKEFIKKNAIEDAQNYIIHGK